ncbi:unnamed protein product [Mytilus edulis]|uniref:B box-type domain-containing protein n=1 Tax=Mytilus edulis TaxID=6550 RepID=A0A8S3TJA7_MYTED|nr:unnamed protein product [Mytilus edulis]
MFLYIVGVVMASSVHCGPCLYDIAYQNAKNGAPVVKKVYVKSAKTHPKNKTSRDYGRVSIGDCRQMEVVLISSTCRDHNKKLEWFCMKHEEPLCMLCLSSRHRSCPDIIKTDVASTNARQSAALFDLQEAIEVTLCNITLCINSQKPTPKDIEKQEKDIRTIIINNRTKINDRLDKLEEKLVQTLLRATKTCTSKCNNCIQQFKIQEERFYKLKDQVMQMKKCVSDQQVFLGTRQFNKLVTKVTESIKTATDYIYNYKFNLHVNSDIQKLSNDVIKEIGYIQVTEQKLDLDIKELKIQQAQMPQKIQPSCNVADVNLLLIKKFNIMSERPICITGCAILPNGHLVCADFYSTELLEYSEEGNYIGCIPVSASPFDITVLDSDRIAISYGTNGFFEILNFRNSRVEKKIKTGEHCWGLIQSNGKIFVKLERVHVFDINGYLLYTVAAEGTYYISTNKNNLFCSNYLDGYVRCFDMNGKEVWKFHVDSFEHHHPLAVASDRSGNVFVFRKTSRNLILIQQDGKAHKNLVNLGNISPRAVCYNIDQSTLLICDHDGAHCVLYKVLYK